MNVLKLLLGCHSDPAGARWPAGVAMLALVTWLGLAPVANGSTPSTQTFDGGLELLEAGRYDDARKQFEIAVRADDKDPEARFFLGVALNRVSRPSEALDQLEKARKMGNDNPDLPFETGWSLVMLHDWARAVGPLEAYQRDHPGRGQTSEFLGRAYLGLKRFADAGKAFDRAVALDPDLKPTVDLYRAELAQALGNPSDKTTETELALIVPGAGARSHSGFAGQYGPGRYGPIAPTPDVVADPLTSLLRPAAASPWRLQASLGAGYDTNARGLEGGTETDINRAPSNGAASAFAQLTLDAAFHFVETPGQRIWAGLDVFERAYARRGIHSDFLAPELFLDLEQTVAKSLLAAVRLTDNYTLVDYAGFRNQIGASAAIDWEATTALRLEGSCAYAYNDYLFAYPRPFLPTPGTSIESPRNYLDEDAQAHTLTSAVYWTLPGTLLKLRGAYFHTWNFAHGSDFDFEANGVLAGFATPIPWGMTAEIGYEYTIEHYTHINEATLQTTPLRPVLRHDSITSVTVRFTKPLGPQMTAYLEYDFNLDKSNLGFYGYEQNVIGTGLIWRF